jgi:hypothetical protein
MTALVWDQPGDRRYETGIDHGVLYLPGGGAVPWNGLVSLTETRSREVKSFYMDGFKYLDYSIPGAYAAKLQAFTYPDELEDLIGNRELWPGVTVYDQRAKRFNLSYQTRIGNDLDHEDYGFHLHLVYNVTAVESDVAFNTMGESFSAATFEWALSGVPNVPGSEIFSFGPSSHFSIHSRKLEFSRVGNLLNHLYGTDTTAPAMPDLSTLASIATA